jgi:ABC-2 type transport system ATP-binding protein
VTELRAGEPKLENTFVSVLRELEGEIKTPPFPATHETRTEDRGKIAIEARDLQKTFGDFRAVKDVNLEVRPGEIYGLLGANGAGKTTTIKMLCGLVAPSGGSILLAGERGSLRSSALRRRIGYMSQRFGLYDDLTVQENIRFYATIYGLHGGDRSRRIAELIEELDLKARVGQLAGTLSGGWKQRLSLACAIAHRPDMLFLDEPTAGVDPAARRHFWQTIYELAERGTTILVTTHYMDEAERCERLAFLSRGHLIAVGTAEEVTAHFGQPTIEDVFIELQRRDEGVTV